MPDVREPALQLVPHALGRGRRNVLHVQHHQRVDHDHERQRIEQEARVHRLRLVVAVLTEHAQRGGEEQRAQHARDVELDRVQRHRVRQILLVDERRDERLIRGPAERLRNSGDEREQEDVPHLHHLEVHQDRQHPGGRHLQVLRCHEGPPPVVAIGEDAANQREQDDRQLLQEGVEAEEEGRIGQRDDEPVLRDDLHPRADARGAGAEPLHAEVAVGERREHAAHGPGANRRGWRRRGRSVGLGNGWSRRRCGRFGQRLRG